MRDVRDQGTDARTRCLVLLLAVLVLFLEGCGGANQLDLVEWTLSTEKGTEVVHLPTRFTRVESERPTTFTLERDVDLPGSLTGKDLEIAFPGFQGMADLAIDGETTIRLERTPFDRHRSVRAIRFAVPARVAGRGRVHLSLSVPYAWAHSAWFEAVPVMAVLDQSSASSIDRFNHVVALFAFGADGFMALLYGLLAALLVGPRRRVFLLFTLAAVLNLSYPAFLLGWTEPVFGTREVAVEAVLLMFAAISAVHFARAYFGTAPPSRFWLAWIGVTAPITFFIGSPMSAPRLSVPFAAATTLANAIVQLSVVLQGARRERRPTNLFVISLAWPATAALAVPDFVLWSGIGRVPIPLLTACIGMTIISVLQGFALLRDHMNSLRAADALNTELAARVEELEAKQREVALLNDDLRRQIASRSNDLARVLAKEPDAARDARRSTPPPEIGAVVEGRYRIVKELGGGGMGLVCEVERLADGVHFALKRLRGIHDPLARARFAREAAIAATLKHPQICAVVDFDVAVDGDPFLVMDLVRGITLAKRSVSERPLAWKLDVLGQTAKGLAAIHDTGIVHRDLKPANVLVEEPDAATPHVKISDFGIARWADELALGAPRGVGTAAAPRSEGDTAETLTFTIRDQRAYAPDRPSPNEGPDEGTDSLHFRTGKGVIVGTPHYMAPELAVGEVTAAADVFAFGVLAFELLAGIRPFERCSLRAVLAGESVGSPRVLAELAGDVPKELAELLQRALSVEPRGRPSARELAEAFTAWTSSTGS